MLQTAPSATAASLAASVTASRLVPLAVLLAVVAPILAVETPALVDYANHLARMHVLARDGSDTAHPLYQVTWTFVPNLAMDLLVPPLAALLGVEAATKAFLVVAKLLVASGAMALERVVRGRLRFSPIAACLFAYATPFAWGFVNFEFGFGLALWGIAAWIALSSRPLPVRAAVNALCVVALFAAHLFALGIYGLVAGLYELSKLASRRTGLAPAAAALLVLAAPAAALAVAMAALGGEVGGAYTRWSATAKPAELLLGGNGFSAGVAMTTAAVAIAFALVLAWRRAVRFLPGGAAIAGGLLVAFVLMPPTLRDTAFVDVRVVVAALFVVPAFIDIAWPSAGLRRLAKGLAGLLVLANIGVALQVQLAYREDFAELRRSFALIAPGSAVLVAHAGEGRDPPLNRAEYPMYHAPVLAVAYADALVPTFFTYPGKQPVTPRPAYARLDAPQMLSPTLADLVEIARGRPVAHAPGLLSHWTRDFAYLYVIGAEPPNQSPAPLREIASGPRFTLYAVDGALTPDAPRESSPQPSPRS